MREDTDMARTVRIVLLLSLVAATGCRFAARQKTSIARLMASSLVSPFTELQNKAPLTQSSFRNDVVTPKQQSVAPAPKPAAAPVAHAGATPEAISEPLILAALNIPENLPGVAKPKLQTRVPFVLARARYRVVLDEKAIQQLTEEAHRAARATRVRIENGRRCIIVIDADAPHPPIGG